jgi:beta-lactamase superfamily II metal-dependent hydrolase
MSFSRGAIGQSHPSKNDDSMFLLLNYGQSSVRLEGDAERAVGLRIAVLYHPNVDLLRAGQHRQRYFDHTPMGNS